MLFLSVGHQSDIVESRNRKLSDFTRVVTKLQVRDESGQQPRISSGNVPGRKLNMVIS